jgi:hypothetical protein
MCFTRKIRRTDERKLLIVTKTEVCYVKNWYKLTHFVAEQILKSSLRKTRDICIPYDY